MLYSETIEVFDINNSINNEYMKVHKGIFLPLSNASIVCRSFIFVQGHSDFINICPKATGQTGSQVSNTGPLVLWFSFDRACR